MASVIGYAGRGKSAILGVARDAWEAQGYSMRGAGLSGIAAKSLEGRTGIRLQTRASFEYQWGQRCEQLGSTDVLVIDKAGMTGPRQMERALSHARQVGAKRVQPKAFIRDNVIYHVYGSDKNKLRLSLI